MGDPPTLSVVIPTRDTRALVLRCLKSLERGGVPDLDVVVVDDGGSDGSAEAIAIRFPRVRVLRNPRSLGFTKSANKGLKAAEGSVVLLLNSDTEVAGGGLGVLLEGLGSRPRMGIAGASLYYPDGSPQWSSGPEPTPLWLLALASGFPPLLRRLPGYIRWRRWLERTAAGGGTEPRQVTWVTGAAMALRRHVLDEVGLLDERFQVYGQDLELCLRARDRGWEVWLIPRFEVLHHHGVTIGADPAAGMLGHQSPEALWRDLVRVVEKRRGARVAQRAAGALRWGLDLRLAARRVIRPFIGGSRAQAWREETRILQRARAAWRKPAPPARGP
jgi:GT2 family glycosyltransferase